MTTKDIIENMEKKLKGAFLLTREEPIEVIFSGGVSKTVSVIPWSMFVLAMDKLLADARREVISKVEKELKEVQFIYEHQWTGSDEERLCETCREVVKKRSPCRASSHYSCWRVIEDVLATLREEGVK